MNYFGDFMYFASPACITPHCKDCENDIQECVTCEDGYHHADNQHCQGEIGRKNHYYCDYQCD